LQRAAAADGIGPVPQQMDRKAAPEQVIANERKKEADALAKIEVLEQSIRSL